jgi:hypothetical protein
MATGARKLHVEPDTKSATTTFCEKMEVKKPVAKREEPKREPRERAKTEAAPSKPQASGQIFCDSAGCHAVRSGCHLEEAKPGRVNASASTRVHEICN